jgi:hypothetical protein
MFARRGKRLSSFKEEPIDTTFVRLLLSVALTLILGFFEVIPVVVNRSC